MKLLYENFLEVIKNPPAYFVTSLAIMVFIATFSIIVGRIIEKMDVRAKPNKLITVVIEGIGGFNKFIQGYVGKQWQYVTPFVLTMTLYVFLSNISGVAALDAPTKYTAITFSMSLMSFYIVQSTGVISKGAKHFLGIFQPYFPMLPLNLVSEFVPILSMALRLFGNIAGGALIMTLLYGLLGWGSILVTPPFHALFDIGFGLIQTIVIVLLTIIFTSMKISEEDFEIIKK
ncbi:MAG: F0F1 ATP synthase subunit A [Firmicutes bacterium]|nr:F0F1 ATP synthase subunit A [Bacillota bacterium]